MRHERFREGHHTELSLPGAPFRLRAERKQNLLFNEISAAASHPNGRIVLHVHGRFGFYQEKHTSNVHKTVLYYTAQIRTIP